MTSSLREQVERIINEIYNEGNLELIDEIYAPDIVREVLPFPPITGRDAIRQYVEELRIAYPNLHIEIEEILIDGERSATRFALTGTHEGKSPAIPIPPTGRKVRVRGVTIGQSQNGLIKHEIGYHDNMGLMQQMGLLPGSPPS